MIPLSCWTLDELLNIAGAGVKTHLVFFKEKIMLFAGGWQSWSPGWELATGETNPAKVRIIPQLRKLSAAPWDCKPNGTAPKKGADHSGEADGSFIMYLRAGTEYLVIAAVMDNPAIETDHANLAAPPVCFSVSKDRKHIRAGVYLPGNTEQYRNRIIAELRIFTAHGYFKFTDTLKEIYQPEKRFNSLQFLGSGKPGISFRPGGYASWYNHYTEINEKVILSDLKGLLEIDNLVAIRYLRNGQPAVFQIDDGWEKAVGEWEIDNAKFPNGLKGIAKQVEDAGLIPGLWLAPFLVTRKSKIFREKPEWLLRKDGCPVSAGWNPNWDGVFYCLDLSRDDVLEYLRSLMNRVIDEWGFRYLKLDFLYAGFLPGAYTTEGTAAEYYERAVSLLTARTANAAGFPLAYLGCGLPLGSSYRHFPLSRIGTDTKEKWDWIAAKLLNHEGRPSALLSLRDTIGRSFMNGTIYINDPDVIFLRSKNCFLSETEKELIALVNYLLAGQILCSDDFLLLSKGDLSFAMTINELYNELPEDQYGAVGLEKEVFRLESRSGGITGIINLSGKPYLLKDHTINFSGGVWLVDHRIKADKPGFAPHSISIYSHTCIK